MDFNFKKNSPAINPNEAYAEMMGFNRKDIQQIPVEKLVAYPDQPFKPYSDEKLHELAEDIKDNGVLSPIIIRPLGKGYQILAGHNRTNASKLAGLETVPCIVKDVDDETAQLILVNTNLNQRQELLPSEKAYAYKMQMESIKSQGKRTDLTLYQVGTKLDSGNALSEKTTESRTNIFRYIRLTLLTNDFLEQVDSGKLAFLTGVELSYLPFEEQDLVFDFVQNENKKISLDKAKVIRQLSDDRNLSDETLLDVFCKKKKPPTKISIPIKKLNKYFSSHSTEKEMLDVILKALEMYERIGNETI